MSEICVKPQLKPHLYSEVFQVTSVSSSLLSHRRAAGMHTKSRICHHMISIYAI